MKRDCDSCGNQYDARSRLSKFCVDVDCRRRRDRERKRPGFTATVIDLPATVTFPESPRGRIEEATFTELVAAGRATTSVGWNVLALAARLDGAAGDTGSSFAALSKQHLAALAEALRDAPRRADGVDELTARRQVRRGA